MAQLPDLPADAGGAAQLSQLLQEKMIPTQVLYGPEALVSAVTESGCDTVMAAIVGAAGLVVNLKVGRDSQRMENRGRQIGG